MTRSISSNGLVTGHAVKSVGKVRRAVTLVFRGTKRVIRDQDAHARGSLDGMA